MLAFHPISYQPISTLAVAAGGSNNTMAAPLGTLTLTGLVPTFTQGNSLTAVLGTMTLTGLVPTFGQGNSVTAPLGTLTLTGLVPTFTQPVNMTAPLGTLTLTGLVPTFTQPHTLVAPLGTLTLTGLTPTFDQSGGQIMSAPLGTMTLTGLVPAFSQSGGAVAVSVVGSGPGAKKRKRHILEIDGELFEVRDLRHAQQILAQVRELADQNAQRIAKAEVKPELPKITTNLPEAQPQVDQTQAMIQSLYEAAARGEQFLAELKRRQEDDDDDAISILLL